MVLRLSWHLGSDARENRGGSFIPIENKVKAAEANLLQVSFVSVCTVAWRFLLPQS